METTFNTCYKTEAGILPCKEWPGNGDGGKRRRRDFKVEVRPAGNRQWSVEIRPTRVSMTKSKMTDTFFKNINDILLRSRVSSLHVVVDLGIHLMYLRFF